MNVQTSYPPYMLKGVPGQLADCTVKDTLSGCALEQIPFGLAVCATNIPDYGYMLPGSRATTVLVTGPFVAGNSLVITINGVAQPALAYNTYGSYAGMIAAIEEQLRGLAYVQNVNTVVEGLTPTASINVVVQPPATSGITSFAITGGASQPTVALTQAAVNNFYGIAQKSNLAAPYFPNINGQAPFQGYSEGQCMNILRKGRIYTTAEQDVVKGQAVFVRIVDGGGFLRGSFRTSAGTSEAVAAPLYVYTTNAAAGEIVTVEINP